MVEIQASERRLELLSFDVRLVFCGEGGKKAERCVLSFFTFGGIWGAKEIGG